MKWGRKLENFIVIVIYCFIGASSSESKLLRNFPLDFYKRNRIFFHFNFSEKKEGKGRKKSFIRFPMMFFFYSILYDLSHRRHSSHKFIAFRFTLLCVDLLCFVFGFLWWMKIFFPHFKQFSSKTFKSHHFWNLKYLKKLSNLVFI